MSRAVEYGKTRTQFFLWSIMTIEIGAILGAAQLLVLLALQYAFFTKDQLGVCWKYAMAKGAVFLTGNPDMTLTLDGHEYTLTAEQLVNSQSVKTLLTSETGKLFICLLASCVVYFAWPLLSRYFEKKDEEAKKPIYVRGSRLYEDEKEFYADVKKATDGEKPTIPMAGVLVPESVLPKHTVVVGKPGTGKTNDLNKKIAKIRQLNQRAVIHDPKGDYTSLFFDESMGDTLFNPLDTRSNGWTLFNEITTKMDIQAVAMSLIPPASGEALFWNNAARDLFISIMLACHQGGKYKNVDVYQLAVAELAEIKTRITGISGAEPGLAYLDDLKLGANVRACMLQFVRALEFAADGPFSITKWIRDENEKGFIFVSNFADIKDTLRPLLSLAIDLLGKRLLSMPDSRTRRVHFLIDEFAQLQKLPTIVDLLAVGRSKGACVDLRFQDFGSVKKIYGPDHADSIINACSNAEVYGVADPHTADFFSQKIGDVVWIKANNSQSVRLGDAGDGVTVSMQEKQERLVLPSDLTNLRDFHCYLKIANCDWLLTKVTYQSFPPKCEAFKMKDEFDLDKLLVAKIETEQSIIRLDQLAKTKEEEAEKRKQTQESGGGLNEATGSLSGQIENLDNDHTIF